jgi:hypothetical protein
VNFLSHYLGKSIIAHVASSKDECLNKLMEYDFEPEGLPVGLGGTWTGGCEPWRKGCGARGDVDELSLEIETDLSCLFRTVLWTHEQVQQQQQALPAAAQALLEGNTLPAHLENSNTTTTTRASATREKSGCLCPSDDSQGHARLLHTATVALRDSPVVQQQSHETLRGTCSGSTRANAVGSRRRNSEEMECARDRECTRRRFRAHHPVEDCQNDVDDDDAEDEAKKRARRRQMHTEADRVRRAKGRIEVEVLQEQVLELSTMNQSLKNEEQRLEKLVQAANNMVSSSCR